VARPQLLNVDPEMRRWCGRIDEEISEWPNVRSRPMFGLTAYYRGDRIFAAIPRTRAVDTPFSFLIKLPDATVDRLRQARGPGAGWTAFDMSSEADLAAALDCLSRAYQRAGRRAARRK
jgi:hypothetical protein